MEEGGSSKENSEAAPEEWIMVAGQVETVAILHCESA